MSHLGGAMNDEIEQAKKHISAAQEHAALSAIHLALAKKLEQQRQFHTAMANTSDELTYLRHKISEQKAKLFMLQHNPYHMFDADMGLKANLFHNEVNYDLGEESYNYAWIANYAIPLINKVENAINAQLAKQPYELAKLHQKAKEESEKLFKEGLNPENLLKLHTKLISALAKTNVDADLKDIGYEYANLLKYRIKHPKLASRLNTYYLITAPSPSDHSQTLTRKWRGGIVGFGGAVLVACLSILAL